MYRNAADEDHDEAQRRSRTRARARRETREIKIASFGDNDDDACFWVSFLIVVASRDFGIVIWSGEIGNLGFERGTKQQWRMILGEGTFGGGDDGEMAC